MGRLLYYFGGECDETLGVLGRILHKGMTFVDVGANIGTHTLFAAKRADKVLAFEPDPDTFGMLMENAAGLPNVTAHNLALGSRNGAATFYVNADSAKSSLVPRDGSPVAVEITRLDDLMDAADVLKIDVEGAEPEVLAGASRLLRCKAIGVLLFEVSERAQEIFDLLTSAGYGIYQLNCERISEPGKMTFNCLATHDPRLLPG